MPHHQFVVALGLGGFWGLGSAAHTCAWTEYSNAESLDAGVVQGSAQGGQGHGRALLCHTPFVLS